MRALGLLLCLARPVGAQEITVVDQVIARSKIVAGTTTPSASPLTVVGLTGSGDILRVGAGGSVGIGSIQTADIPGVFARKDVAGGAQSILNNWTFGGTFTLTGIGASSSGTLLRIGAGGTVGSGVLADADVPTNFLRANQATATISGLWTFGSNLTLSGDLALNGGDLTSTGQLAITPAGLTLNPALNLAITPGQNIYIGPGGGLVLPTMPFSVSIGTDQSQFRELHVANSFITTLVEQQTQTTIGGRLLVGASTHFTIDMAAEGGVVGSNVEHDNLAVGDTVYVAARGQTEYMVVVGGPYSTEGHAPYGYFLFRNADGSGAKDWRAGDAVFNTGRNGSGWMDFYAGSSMGGNALTGPTTGPTLVGNMRYSDTNAATGACFNCWQPMWAVGNLNGLFSNGANVYGAVFGNQNLTNVQMDASNGFTIRNAGTVLFRADQSGNLLLAGNLSVAGSGSFGTALNCGVTSAPCWKFLPTTITGYGVSDGTEAGSPASGTPLALMTLIGGTNRVGLTLRNTAGAVIATLDRDGLYFASSRIDAPPFRSGGVFFPGAVSSTTLPTGLFQSSDNGTLYLNKSFDPSVPAASQLILRAGFPPPTPNASQIVLSGESSGGITLTPSSSGIVDLNGTTRARGRFVVQDTVDGGSSRGIWLWSAVDPNWGIYMATPGAGHSLSGGTAAEGPPSSAMTTHMVRFRAGGGAYSQGFLFENDNEAPLVAIRGIDGVMWTRLLLPWTDGGAELGNASTRWANIHLNLPGVGATFPYIVTGDTSDTTRLGAYCGYTNTLPMTVPTSLCPSGVAYWTTRCGVVVTVACG